MQCPRCLNQDIKKIRKLKERYYCLNCIEFGRLYIDEDIIRPSLSVSTCENTDFKLPFVLSDKQITAAKELINYISRKENVLVYAACGAGKTEIIMPLISYALLNKLKIAIAIPRKEVVIEIGLRLQKAFEKKDVCMVYGGHNEIIDGDIIVATTHQMYRYHQAFDILIIDEADAFPFIDNEVLEQLSANACRGQMVYLSATPSLKQKQLPMITLFERPHSGKLCVPDIRVGWDWYLMYQAYQFIKKYSNKCILFFVPTIKQGELFYKFFKMFYNCTFISSKTLDRELMFSEIKQHKYHLVLCTSVLERGITISDVQVIVWLANHPVFNESSLIQISGRVGRDRKYQEGECLFLSQHQDVKLSGCVRQIRLMNNGEMYNLS